MKNLWLLSFCTVLISCTAVRQIKDQEIVHKKQCESFDLSDGAIVLKTTIDGKKHDLLVDTGATLTIINDTTVITDLYKKEVGSLGTVVGSDRKNAVARRSVTVDFETTLFESKNKVVTLISKPQSKCGSSSIKGIIGTDCFFGQEDPLFLNFTDGKICLIDQAQMQSRLENKGYREVKSTCSLGKVYIYLTVAGTEHKFTFDTGYTGQIVMPYDEKLNWDNYNRMELDGSAFATAISQTQGTETYFEKVPVLIAGHKLNAKPILSGTIKSQVVGIQFLKGFDWIIDYSNNKVYAKRNHLKIEDLFLQRVQYQVTAKDKLLVTLKERKQTRYNLGDEIVSVNGQKVTPENNCEWQAFLNKTEDWSAIDLQVSPVVKP
ncbi:pepsin/retropepsin-like aspartic protease family protein [Flavobacterium caeni]|uniref:Aspartyl protease n=1 Tax=Flavobacterium caeni TaxID=490189 RepID=A0A1G5GXE4_9FLAO|nr:hypothetical protein [Flavobacterium caeni]SCY55810.1 aspartyl protease [Flavobacterium caeni]